MTNKFQVLIKEINWPLADMFLDYFEEEDQIEIVMSSLEEPTVKSPNIVVDTSMDIDDIKMLVAETFIMWSEENGM